MPDTEQPTKKSRGGARPGAGRKTPPQFEQRAAYLRPQTWQALEAIATARDTPLATLVRDILERAAKRIK